MTHEQLLQTSLALPLMALGLNYLFTRVANLRDGANIVVASGLFFINIQLAGRVFAGDVVTWDSYEMVPGFRIAFAIEPLGMLFSLVASGLWILTTIYAVGYLRSGNEENQTRFFGCSRFLSLMN
jgi:multicomponent Na+:H+ antiporter subunit D